MLTDDDERVRAFAAQGLARLRDPRALDALVRTIDDFPDVLRQPFTPSADELINLGLSALSRVALLLDAQEPMTRARAFLVIRMMCPPCPKPTRRGDNKNPACRVGRLCGTRSIPCGLNRRSRRLLAG